MFHSGRVPAPPEERFLISPSTGVTIVTKFSLAVAAALLIGGTNVGTFVAPALGEEPPKLVVNEIGAWPTWCGNPSRNSVSQEKTLIEGFEEWNGAKDPGQRRRNVQWIAPLNTKAKADTQVWGSPVVAGGRVYLTGALDGSGSFDVSTTDVLWCFKESDGSLLWRFRSRYIKNLYNRSFGVSATPTVEDDRVYLVNQLGDVLCLDVNGLANGNQGPYQEEGALLTTGRELVKKVIDDQGKTQVEITAGTPQDLDAADGDVLWRFDMYREVNCRPYNCLTSGILIHGDLLFLGTCSTSMDRGLKWSPIMIALDKKTGKLVAMNETGVQGPGYHGANATPSYGVVNGKGLVFYADGRGMCYAFDPDPQPGQDGRPGTLKMVWRFDCLKPPIPQKWPDFEIIATPVFHKSRIYVSLGCDPKYPAKTGVGQPAIEGRLVCIDATKQGDISETGLVWKLDEFSVSCSTIAISDGLLFTADMHGIVYCLEAETGKVLWRHEAGIGIWGSPLVADGKVYLGTNGKGLLIFAAAREKRIIHDSGRLGVVSLPAAANGVLYIASHHALFALKRD
jgi:outer membrane protein assembly factor BamB